MAAVCKLSAMMPARSFSEGGFTDIVGYTALMGSDEDWQGILANPPT